jgi:hypothetical protein
MNWFDEHILTIPKANETAQKIAHTEEANASSASDENNHQCEPKRVEENACLYVVHERPK